jgi:hypothetical protein
MKDQSAKESVISTQVGISCNDADIKFLRGLKWQA